MSHIDSFNEHRSLLFSIAYRMLGSAMDADDMVQETFLRWQKISLDQVESSKAYLTTIITRLCLDHLRSARVKRERYFGPWLPEPLITGRAGDALEPVALADSLSMAFLVLLESLTPTERAVFLLREVFDYDYAEIAEIVDKSEANCRQMVRRARQSVTARRPRFEPSVEAQQQLAGQFMETCLNGDMPGLIKLLAEDITLWSDGGGKVVAASQPLHGPDRVARFILGLAKKAPAGFMAQFGWANHQPAVIGYLDQRPVFVMILDIAEGRIQAIRNVVNPEKLQAVPELGQGLADRADLTASPEPE